MFNVPQTSGSGLDTWEPLIRIADGYGEQEWLREAWVRVAEANDALVDGYHYEMEEEIVSAIVKFFCHKNQSTPPSILNCQEPVPLTFITTSMNENNERIHPRTIGTKLRKMCFNVRKQGGRFQVFTTPEKIKGVAKEIGYEDEALK